MNKITFKSRKETTEFLKEKGIDTSNWVEKKWLSINKSQADIHIQAIAELMWDAYNESKPNQLQEGQWHTPFGNSIDLSCSSFDKYKYTDRALTDSELDQLRVKVAVARCARISYETLGDNPKIDYEADIKLHDILAKSGHWSPFEHIARSMNSREYDNFVRGRSFHDWSGISSSYQTFDRESRGWCNNFRGFIQYRYLIEK